MIIIIPHPLWHPPLTPDWRPDSPTIVCDVVCREWGNEDDELRDDNEDELLDELETVYV